MFRQELKITVECQGKAMDLVSFLLSKSCNKNSSWVIAVATLCLELEKKERGRDGSCWLM